MKDISGKKVKAGDIMLDVTGGGCDNKGPYRSCSIYEVPRKADGRGIAYHYTGESYEYWWARVEESHKISDLVDANFIYSFRHGMHELKSYADWNADIKTLLENLDLEKEIITPEQVDLMTKVNGLNLETEEDLKKHASTLKEHKDILTVGTHEKIVRIRHNGKACEAKAEIGLAALYNMETSSDIIDSL